MKATRKIIKWLAYYFGRFLSDKNFLKLEYHAIMGDKLNFKTPITFNEKLHWLKIYDKKSIYTKMADKYEVRDYVSEKIGEEYLIPLLGVWNKFSDIDFNLLPNQFVLKCTHDSKSVIICMDKTIFSISHASEQIKKCLKINYYYFCREWAYKNIKPKIIAEKYMVDESGTELKDYKIYCFNGDPKIIQVDFNRFTGHKRNFYSTQWKYQNIELIYPSYSDIIIKKPQLLNIMLDCAKKLSAETMFLRTDFYLINDKIYFGELTFYPEAGYGRFIPAEWDKLFGDWLDLPLK
jgi:hypothetical protein